MVILYEGLHATTQVACESGLPLLSNDLSDDRSAISLRDGCYWRERDAVRTAT
jgi:hypothetical protein